MSLVLSPSVPDWRALSLTQPWAWLVASGAKDIENRPRGFAHKSFRGEFFIHATTEPDSNCYRAALTLCERYGVKMPKASELDYGGIIGRARIVGLIPPVSSYFESSAAEVRQWHFPDQYGFIVTEARLVPFVPCRGALGFWRVPRAILLQLEAA